MLDCWQKSDSKSAFVNALAEQGLILARGDRRGFVAVDHTGQVYSLSRWLGVKARDLASRLGNQEDLPSVTEALAKLKAKKGEDYQSKIAKAVAPFRGDLAAFETKRAELKQRFSAVQSEMTARHQAEMRALYHQLPLQPKSRFPPQPHQSAVHRCPFALCMTLEER